LVQVQPEERKDESWGSFFRVTIANVIECLIICGSKSKKTPLFH
jgi:hypothetical protein